jgi:hypothetical protein
MAAELFAGLGELFDLGISCHMSPYYKQFVTYEEITARPITAANNEVFHAIGMGDLAIQVPNGETSNTMFLRDVLHVPDMCLTVVLISHIIKAEYIVEFANGHCIIKRGQNGPIIGHIPASQNGLFKAEHAFAAADAPALAEPVDILTLHCRGSHLCGCYTQPCPCWFYHWCPCNRWLSPFYL